MTRSDAVQGEVDPAFASVRDVFAGTLAGAPTGSAFAVDIDGRLVVDLWGGAARADGSLAWRRDSIAQPYSVSKPFAAVCLLLLVADGSVDLDAPVNRYWTEFRAEATVRQILNHSSGIVALDRAIPYDDWDEICAQLAAATPLWAPGTAYGEAALIYGHLVGEIVRRVSGRTIGQMLRERVCGSLNLDFAFGLTAGEQERAVELTFLDERYPAAWSDGKPELYEAAMASPPGARDLSVVNGSRWRRAEIPAVNGHGTARAIAGFFAALRDGRVLAADVLAEAIRLGPLVVDRVFGGETSWGLGFALDGEGFGMGGTGGAVGWTLREGYAFGFVTGALGDHARADSVEQELRRCLGLPPM